MILKMLLYFIKNKILKLQEKLGQYGVKRHLITGSMLKGGAA